MRKIMDAHLHSRFSRATSQNMNVDGLFQWSKYKGIDIIGTGDFTHPFWLAELKEKLRQEETGLLSYKKNTDQKGPFFILTAEISAIYTQGNKTRKIHLIIFAPSLEVVEKLNKSLEKIGNIYSDGRPIFGASALELSKIILDTSEDFLIVPAHIWTPWFSLFGSNSGFDSIAECFQDLTPHIKAIETGLSSDPEMNWRLSALDNITLLSFSDAHSPQKLGREATVFDLNEVSYGEVIQAIKDKDKKKILYTVEFFPEEGKYHFDGHRACDVSQSPEESKKMNNKCPKCGKELTIGVLHRVSDLASRKEGEKPDNVIPYKNLVPLQEIIAETQGQKPSSTAVFKEYQNIIVNLAPELPLLSEMSLEELKGKISPKILEGIQKVRDDEVGRIPGYDGVFGVIKLKEGKSEKKSKQQKLF